MNIAEQYLAMPWDWQMEWDNDENAFLVTIAEIPDFFAAGADAATAALNARDAFISHINGYLATGTPIPEPKKRESATKSATTDRPILEPVAA